MDATIVVKYRMNWFKWRKHGAPLGRRNHTPTARWKARENLVKKRSSLRCACELIACYGMVMLYFHWANPSALAFLICELPKCSFNFLKVASTCNLPKVTAADENRKSVVNSEIELMEQSDYFKQMIMEIPEKFPFEIIDNSGDQSIILKREFMGETIKATVFSEAIPAEAYVSESYILYDLAGDFQLLY